MKPSFHTLLQAAILAPSGDNTQPWRFVVDEDVSAIEIHVDDTRDLSPMNAGQRMARIACGAALENIVRTAEHNAWPIAVESSCGAALATVRLWDGVSDEGSIDEVVSSRVTNRRFYDALPLAARLVDELGRMPEIDANVSCHWVIDRSAIRKLAEVVGEADALMFGNQAMRRAFLANIRFDLPTATPAQEGLPLGTLGLGSAERWGLSCLRYLPDPLVKFGGVLRSFRRRAEDLVESASGLCVLSARNESAETDVAVGRMLQRAWLTLTAAGLAVQPMMSLPVLDRWRLEQPDPRAIQGIAELSRRALRELSLSDGPRIAAVLRFGHAPPPMVRAKRRDLEICVVFRNGSAEYSQGNISLPVPERLPLPLGESRG